MKDTIKEQALGLCEILYNKKALDIMAIHVGDKTIVADWFVIASGRAVPQIKALCDEVDEKCTTLGLEVRRREGYGDGRWIVLDFGDILLHIFHPEERRYYSVERLWNEDNDAIVYDDAYDAQRHPADKPCD